ncbi:hypothetical protein B1P93_04935 [Enterococcus faecium]|nr:hypothetical protein B1P93_04935 [Enterococcus faecium]
MVHSDSDLILHNSSVLIDKEPKILDSIVISSSSFLMSFIFLLLIIVLDKDVFLFYLPLKTNNIGTKNKEKPLETSVSGSIISRTDRKSFYRSLLSMKKQNIQKLR